MRRLLEVHGATGMTLTLSRRLIASMALAVLIALPAIGQTPPRPSEPRKDLVSQRAAVDGVLHLKALTLAMRVTMKQLDEAAAARDVATIGGRLLSAEKPATWSDVFASEHREAAIAFFDHVAQAIARPQRWPSDQSTETYRLLAKGTLSDGRSMHAEMLAKSRYPGLGIDEAYTALAWSQGRKPAATDPAMPTRLAERLLDRALPEVSAPGTGGTPKDNPTTRK